MQSADDNQGEVHAKVEHLKQLRFRRRENDDAADLRQRDAAEDLGERTHVSVVLRSDGIDTYRTAHFCESHARSIQTAGTGRDREVPSDVRAELHGNANRLEERRGIVRVSSGSMANLLP